MAKCKRCKTNIPDGAEYCKDCLDKEKAKSNEAYLDSLLSSVKNTAPATESIYMKKNSDSDSDNSIITSDRLFDSASEDEDFYKFDIGDIEDFDHFDLEDDLSEWDTDIDKDVLYNSDAAASYSNEDTEKQEDDRLRDTISEAGVPAQPQEDTDKTVTAASQMSEEEKEDTVGGLNDEDDYDSALNELLNNLESIPSDNSSAKPDTGISPENNPADSVQTDDTQVNSNPIKDNQENDDQISTEQSMEENDEDDFLSLLNQISEDDPVAEDVKAINDLMNGTVIEEGNASNIPSDVGEVFSDALKAVSSLNDPNINEDELLNRLPDGTGIKKKKKKSKKKKKKGEEQNSPNLSEKPKKGLLKRLFGNVEDGKGAEYEGGSEAGANTADQKASKKNKAEKRAKKASKDEDSSLNEGKDKQNKKEAKKNKKNSKKEKKQSKLKTAEVIQVIDEIDEDLGRINRLGASIVFLFFGLLALLLYVGTSAITYTLSIQHASSYFSIKEYTKAYNEVYGMEIKPEDFQLYEKIQTVMFVNKQLNSYNNYYSIGEYPEALDSLLKGLERYDKYIKLADLLDITTDMDYVREQLLAELKKVFGISEKEALKINDIGNMKEYSLKVYEIAQQLKSEIKSLSKGT